jgi:hypothetical protein
MSTTSLTDLCINGEKTGIKTKTMTVDFKDYLIEYLRVATVIQRHQKDRLR